MATKPRNLFFDIDDVLFPSTEFSKLARKNSLNAMIELGLNVNFKTLNNVLERVIKETDSNYSNHFGVVLEKLGIEKMHRAKFVAGAVSAYHDTKASIHPYPDVPLVLMNLKKRYALYVASEGIAIKQWDKLIRMKLALFFNDVFVSEDLGMQKSQEFYLKIAKIINVKPFECVMIGDREDKDIVFAKNAGWRAVRIRRKNAKHAAGKTHANMEITSLTELTHKLAYI